MPGEPINNEPRPATLPGTDPVTESQGAELPDHIGDISDVNEPVRTDLVERQWQGNKGVRARGGDEQSKRRRDPRSERPRAQERPRREPLTQEQIDKIKADRKTIRDAYREFMAPADEAIFGDYPTEEITVVEDGKEVKKKIRKQGVKMSELSLRERFGEFERRFLTDTSNNAEDRAESLQRLRELLVELPGQAKPIAEVAETAFGAKIDAAGIDRQFVSATDIRSFEVVNGKRKAVDQNVADLVYSLQNRVAEFRGRATNEAVKIGTRFVDRLMASVYDRIKKATTVRWDPVAPRAEFNPIVLDSKLSNIEESAGLATSLPEIQKVYDDLVRFVTEKYPSTTVRPTEGAKAETTDGGKGAEKGKSGKGGKARGRLLRHILKSERTLSGDFKLFVADPVKPDSKPVEAAAPVEGEEVATKPEVKAETKVAGRWVAVMSDRDLLTVPGIFELIDAAHQAVDGTNGPKAGEVVDVLKERAYLMRYVDAQINEQGVDSNRDAFALEVDIDNTAAAKTFKVKRFLPEHEVKQRVVKRALRPSEFKPDNIKARNGIEAQRAQVILELGKPFAAAIEHHIDRIGGLSLEEIDNLYWGFIMRGYDEEPAELRKGRGEEASEYDKKPGEKDEEWRARRATMIQERKLRIGAALGVYELDSDKKNVVKINVPAIATLINEIQADARYISAYREGLEMIAKKVGPSITRALRPLLTEIPIQERAEIVDTLADAIDSKVRQLEKKSAEWKALHGETGGKTNRYADVLASLPGCENQAARAKFIDARRKLMLDSMGIVADGSAVGETSARVQALLERIKSGVEGSMVFDTPKPKVEKSATSSGAAPAETPGAAAPSGETSEDGSGELADLGANTIAPESEQPDQDAALSAGEVPAEPPTEGVAEASEVTEGTDSDVANETDVATGDEEAVKAEEGVAQTPEEKFNVDLTEFRANVGKAISGVVAELLTKLRKPDGSEYGFEQKSEALVALDVRLHAFERAFKSVAYPEGSTGNLPDTIQKFVGLVDSEGNVDEGALEVAIKQLLANPEEMARDSNDREYVKNGDILGFALPSQLVDRVFKERVSMKDRLLKTGELALTRSDVTSLLEGYVVAVKTYTGEYDALRTFEQFIAATGKAGKKQGLELLKAMKIAKKDGDLDADKIRKLFISWLKPIE